MNVTVEGGSANFSKPIPRITPTSIARYSINFHSKVLRRRSAAVTLSSPGVVADSNGLFHSFGEHADNAFSIHGQLITDQQSKVFSNQLPVDAVQSLEVISGIPPANFGGKNSLVINVTTQSGLEQPWHGSVLTNYGTFGTSGTNFSLSGGLKHGEISSPSADSTPAASSIRRNSPYRTARQSGKYFRPRRLRSE